MADAGRSCLGSGSPFLSPMCKQAAVVLPALDRLYTQRCRKAGAGERSDVEPRMMTKKVLHLTGFPR